MKKAYEYKKLNLNDGGALTKYINSYSKRKETLELIAYPKANDDNRLYEYGSIFPVLFNSWDETIRELELYTYQKITDTYKDNYEHGNIIKMQAYSEFYEKIANELLNSELSNDNLKQYIQDYQTRKETLKNTVNFKMNEIDFSIWFNKLEIYTYKVIVDEIGTNNDEFKEKFENIFK